TDKYNTNAASDASYFHEANTRLKVEHPITEACTGVDLVEWMIRTAAGEPPALAEFTPQPQGAAIEVRLYAEDPVRDFQPSPGRLTEVQFPADARVDTWVASRTEVSPYYDPMIAKIIVHGSARRAAIRRMRRALDQARTAGIASKLDSLRSILAAAFFVEGEGSTSRLADFQWQPPAIEVVEPGTSSSVQDYPGRTGYWSIGV